VSTPRTVVISWADTQGLTVLEQARACVLAGTRPADADKLMRRYAIGDAEPEEILAGALMFYAVGYELALRDDPSLAWDDWQKVDLKIDARVHDPMREAEADAAVGAALATGLPPATAGALTLAEIGAYKRAAAERDKRAPRRRARVRRR
jgi:hypothetical protein